MDKIAIIMSGLPASGKSTLGRSIAHELDFSYLDKDSFLEALYNEVKVKDFATRQKSSRQSDKEFQSEATLSNSVVLVSHWRPSDSIEDTGTPTAWLDNFNLLIEVHCSCPVDIAVERFMMRKRHSGHLDSLRNTDGLVKRMQEFNEGYPLKIGKVVTVETGSNVNLPKLITELKTLLCL